MDAQKAFTENATNIDPETMLYFYRIHKRFHSAFSSLLCWIFIVIFCYGILTQTIASDETFISAKGENKLYYLFIFILCINLFNVAWIMLHHSYALTIQHRDMLHSKCDCKKPRRLVYLIGAVCELTYVRSNYGRLNIICTQCRNIIYAHDIEQNNLFKQ
jgi:hypothetical protein